MAVLKQAVISDRRRGQIHGILRLPLNAFVMVLLLMAGEGELAGGRVFVLCSTLLLLGAVVMKRAIK
ncbi:Hypothetical protein D9617_21g097790 [Elsinoe fawcettii]|nr:Hypothetical protein D9617_21g097790 [Elsinoe fawcettii]